MSADFASTGDLADKTITFQTRTTNVGNNINRAYTRDDFSSTTTLIQGFDSNGLLSTNSTDSTTVTKLPFLGDLPVLGSVFRNRQRTHTKDEVVYKILDTLAKNKPELVLTAPQLNEFSIAGLYKKYPVPYHPGAIKYFQDNKVEPRS